MHPAPLAPRRSSASPLSCDLRMLRSAFLLMLLTAWFSIPAGAVSFTSNFSSGPDPALHVYSNELPPGSETISYTNGQAVFSFVGGAIPPASFNDSYVGLYTSWGLVGDYTVSVDVDATSMVNDWDNHETFSDGYLQTSLGPQGAGAELGFDTSNVGGNVDSTHTDWTSYGAVTGTKFTVEIQRVGNVVSEYYDGQLLHSATGLVSPTGGASIGFWGFGLGNSSVAFSNLQIQADGFTPEPGTCGLGASACLFFLAWYRKRARQEPRK